MKKWRRWTKEEKEALRARYRKDSAEDIARDLGRTACEVRNAALRLLGPAHNNRFRDYKDDVAVLHRRGCSTAEIARRLGVHLDTAASWVRRLGLSGNGCCRSSRRLRDARRKQHYVRDNLDAVCASLHRAYPQGDRDLRVRRFGTMDDLIHTVVERMLLQVASYDPRKTKFTTWAYATAPLLAMNVLEQGGVIRLPRLTTTLENQSEERLAAKRLRGLSEKRAEFLASRDATEEQSLMARAMAVLPERDHALLYRCVVDGWTEEKVAWHEGVEPWRIKDRLRRALARLREEFLRRAG